ncbi:5-bromo-4-chloroindolyl phosphate hydrolysis family protein [Paracoccus aerodenitrificans]|uniref:5-bromo-4-chloroindolyl phosphate hydrolysis family protein n=1 Tax=Paracoccus aerodenitrificans TaxID=3017781 RepID=UPI0022F13A7E|nr:5-bromo-4-chloroindolyl phosphate hydrolysis family protein [Paracoccus aerodenitrificans]WBU63323.1 5-bromo-4-chloroindolyl phosphate hydrolysis family protein [Paracoccus aerodenitrificans]
MAKRFGGRFSPGAPDMPQPRGEPVHPLQSRVKWITISASPFLLSAFWQDPFGLVTNLAGFGIVAAGSMLTREGLQAEAAYDARRVARKPAWPRKLFGGIATGLGLAIGAAEVNALGGAALVGFAGAVLHYMSFGPDPRRDKGMEGIDPFQQDRVARFIAEGEEYLAGMQDAIRRTGDRRLEARVQVFAETARELFRRVEEDPGDLAAARRYLGVYLMGARDATVKFADLYAHTRDQSAREDYERLLTDLEGNFAARTRSLIEGGRTDFDIEMQVLRDRLAREGVRTPAPKDPAALEDRRGHDLTGLIRETVKAGRKQD